MTNRQYELLPEIGMTGVVSDLPQSAAPKDSWHDALNVRFVEGAVEKIGGSYPVMRVNIAANEDLVCGSSITEPSGTRVWYYVAAKGDTADVYRTDGSTTRHDLVFGYRGVARGEWTTISMNGCVYFNHPSIKPIGIIQGGTAKTLSGWADNWRANTLVGFKNYVLALGMNEGGVSYGQRVRFSRRADSSSLPPEWSDLDGKDTQWLDLPAATSDIVCAKPIGGKILIYTSSETFVLDYVGGKSVFRINKVDPANGALNANSVVDFDNKHFVVSLGRVFITTGSNIVEVAANRVHKRLHSSLSESNINAIRVEANHANKEVWLFYSSNKEMDYANRVAIYNWVNNSWTFADCPPTKCSMVSYLPKSDIRHWSDTPSKWRQQNTEWQSVEGDFGSKFIIIGSNDGVFYVLNAGNRVIGGDGKVTPVKTLLVKKHFDMHNVVSSPSGRLRLSRLNPLFEGDSHVSVMVAASDLPIGKDTNSESFMFNTATDYKLDTRVMGRYLTIEISSLSTLDWRMFGMTASIHSGGNR